MGCHLKIGAPRTGSPVFQVLLTDAQLGDDRTVTVDVLLSQIVQQAAALADHLQKAAAAVIIMDVGAQMLGKLVDAVGQDRNLDFRRTGVALMGRVLFDDLVFDFLADHSVFHLSIIFARIPSSGRVCPEPRRYPETERLGIPLNYTTDFLFVKLKIKNIFKKQEFFDF